MSPMIQLDEIRNEKLRELVEKSFNFIEKLKKFENDIKSGKIPKELPIKVVFKKVGELFRDETSHFIGALGHVDWLPDEVALYSAERICSTFTECAQHYFNDFDVETFISSIESIPSILPIFIDKEGKVISGWWILRILKENKKQDLELPVLQLDISCSENPITCIKVFEMFEFEQINKIVNAKGYLYLLTMIILSKFVEKITYADVARLFGIGRAGVQKAIKKFISKLKERLRVLAEFQVARFEKEELQKIATQVQVSTIQTTVSVSEVTAEFEKEEELVTAEEKPVEKSVEEKPSILVTSEEIPTPPTQPPPPTQSQQPVEQPTQQQIEQPKEEQSVESQTQPPSYTPSVPTVESTQLPTPVSTVAEYVREKMIKKEKEEEVIPREKIKELVEKKEAKLREIARRKVEEEFEELGIEFTSIDELLDKLRTYNEEAQQRIDTLVSRLVIYAKSYLEKSCRGKDPIICIKEVLTERERKGIRDKLEQIFKSIGFEKIINLSDFELRKLAILITVSLEPRKLNELVKTLEDCAMFGLDPLSIIEVMEDYVQEHETIRIPRYMWASIESAIRSCIIEEQRTSLREPGIVLIIRHWLRQLSKVLSIIADKEPAMKYNDLIRELEIIIEEGLKARTLIR